MTASLILLIASMTAPQRLVPGDVALPLPLPRPAEPVLRRPAVSSIDSLDGLIDRGARVRVSDDEVVMVLREHFPNMVARDGLEGTRSSPALSGTARGRLAEHVWGRAHSGAEHGGFRPTANPNAPQNDFWSRRLQLGSQVKTHRSVSSYLDSMRSDRLAELFIVPYDHVEAVHQLWKAARRAAIAAGDHAAASEALRQVDRIRPLSRSMAWLEARLRTSVVGNEQEVRLHMSALRDASQKPAATETIVVASEAVVLQHDGEWTHAHSAVRRQHRMKRCRLHR